MCFWQSKYSERGSCLPGNTATEVKANISTRIGARAFMQQFKNRPCKEPCKDNLRWFSLALSLA